MSTFTTIIIFVAILFLCVSVITVIQKKEKEKEAIRQQISKYKFRAKQALDILGNFSTIPIGMETRRVLMEYAIVNYNAALKLNPNDGIVQKNIKTLTDELPQKDAPIDQQKLAIPQDMEQLKLLINKLSSISQYILKIAKHAPKLQAHAQASVKRISALIVESKICAYIQQGKTALTKHEYVLAQRNFTAVKDMLEKISNKNARLQQLEAEVNELTTSTPAQAIDTSLSIEEEHSDEQESANSEGVFAPKKKW